MKILLFLILLISFGGKAQNLVPNPSFEIIDSSVVNLAGVSNGKVLPWYSLRSSDVFCNTNDNSIINLGIPKNVGGYQYPRTGYVYAGFTAGSCFLNQTYSCDYREELIVDLINPMIPNKKYYFRFFVNLPDSCPSATNNLSISFCDSLKTIWANQCNYNIKPIFKDSSLRIDTILWVEISGEYVPNSIKTKLIIFSPDSLKINSDIIKVNYNGGVFHNFFGIYVAYYFVDDVAVWLSDTIPPQADAGEDKTICWGDSVLIGTHNYSDYYYRWKEGLNTTFKPLYDSGAIWVSPKYTTTYVLEATDFRFEKSYDTVRVFVNLCDLKTNEIYVCSGDSIKLNNTQIDSFRHHWEPDVFLSSDSAQSPLCKPKTDVVYVHYTINQNDSIIDSDTLILRVMNCTICRSDTTICLGDEIYLGNSTYPFNSYLWLPFDYLDNNLIANPLSHPLKDIKYYVSAVGTNGITHYDSVTITVKPCHLPLEIEIPNVITPNGDGYNEVFRFKNEEFYHLQTQIFNRWGQLIFTGENTEHWDGTYEGKKVSDGVYFYNIIAQPMGFDDMFVYKGTVTVFGR